MGGDSGPVDALPFVLFPISEPFADAAELGAPPALAELREYIEETDIRFGSRSEIDRLDRSAASGSGECFVSSAMVPEDNLGVSRSSIAHSSLLVLLLESELCLQESVTADAFRLYEDEVRDFIVGFVEGGGIDMLARSEWVSVVPGSAYRPFRDDDEFALDAEDRL